MKMHSSAGRSDHDGIAELPHRITSVHTRTFLSSANITRGSVPTSPSKTYHRISRLQNLPDDLRHRIYRLVVLNVSNELDTQVEPINVRAPKGHLISKHAALPALGATCRDVRQESVKIYFEENIFAFDPRALKLRLVDKWAEAIGHWKSHIRRIIIGISIDYSSNWHAFSTPAKLVLSARLTQEGVIALNTSTTFGFDALFADSDVTNEVPSMHHQFSEKLWQLKEHPSGGYHCCGRRFADKIAFWTHGNEVHAGLPALCWCEERMAARDVVQGRSAKMRNGSLLLKYAATFEGYERELKDDIYPAEVPAQCFICTKPLPTKRKLSGKDRTGWLKEPATPAATARKEKSGWCAVGQKCMVM